MGVEPNPNRESAASRDRSVRARLRLQQRAPDNLRGHLLRAVRRFLVLLGGDLGAFFALRALIGVMREGPAWPFAVALVVAFLVTGNYGQGRERRNPGRLLAGCALAAALLLWATAWEGALSVALGRYVGLTLVLWVALLVERLVLDRAVAVVIPPERAAARTLFVGSAADCLAAQQSATFQPRAGYSSVGFVDLRVPPHPEAAGHVGEFAAALQRTAAETVVVSGPMPQWRLSEVVDSGVAAGCELLALPRALEVAGVEPTPLHREGRVLVRLTAPQLLSQQYILKRAIDLVAAPAGLVVLSPVFLVVAGLIRLDSSGPVFFRQPRVGRGGRFFWILKFRTMHVGADAQRAGLAAENVYRDQRLFKLKQDPRVTRVGRWLRRYSLDELPQLWNVLWGDMSLVGPRPPLPSEVERYEAHHYARFDVKPGITGPWQVAGRSDITDFERVIHLETDYMRRWSLLADLWILCKTVPAVLFRRGAH